MSFRIHAAGTQGFRYSRDNNPDEDIFEAASVISAINASGPSVGGAVDGAAEYFVLPSYGETATRALARVSFTYILRNAVDMLAICTGAANGSVSVYTCQSHLLWPDTNAFSCYQFIPGDDPGAEFIRMILPGLGRTDFNNYGTFRAIALAISRYNDHIGNSGTPMLRLELTK